MRRWTATDSAIILSLGLFLACLFTSTFATRIRIGVATFLKGPLAISNSIVSNIRDSLAANRLARENRALRRANDELMSELLKLQEFARESARLRELLGLRAGLEFRTVACRVISRDISNYTQSLLIDKGLNDGIKVGCGVMSIKGLLGRVIEAGPEISRVLLLTDPNMRVAAKLVRPSNNEALGTTGILWGQGSGLCALKYIENNQDVQVGDLAFTSGQSGLIPKGILLGEVAEVEEGRAQPFKAVYVSPSVDPYRAEEVLCITEPQNR